MQAMAGTWDAVCVPSRELEAARSHMSACGEVGFRSCWMTERQGFCQDKTENMCSSASERRSFCRKVLIFL